MLGLLWAATGWGLMWWPLGALRDHGLAGLQVTATLFLSASVAFLPVALARLRRLPASRRVTRPGVLAAMAVTAGLTQIGFVVGLMVGQPVRVYVLFHLGPAWGIAFAWVLLGERPSLRQAVPPALALVGGGVLLWSPSLGVPAPASTGDWLALMGGAAFALTNVLIRRAGDVPIPVKMLATWGGVVALSSVGLALGVGAGLAPAGLEAGPPPLGAWLALTALGALGLTTMTAGEQLGVTQLPIHRSMTLLLVELVIGTLSQAAWGAGHAISAREWVGAAVVLVAGGLAAAMAREESRVQSAQRPPRA